MIKKKTFYDSYHEILMKLLDQHNEWFIKRHEYAVKNDWNKVKEIEKKYLEPLDRKINKLARIAKEEVEHGK